MASYDVGLGLLRGLQEGIKSYQDRSSRLEELDFQEKQRQDAIKREEQRDSARQTFELDKMAKDFQYKKQLEDQRALADAKKQRSLGSGASGEGLVGNRYSDPLKQLKLEEEVSARTQSPVTGYNKTNRERLTDVDKRTLKGAASSVQSFNNSLDSLKEKVSGASKMDLLNPYSDVSKAIKQDLRNLQLAYKNEDFAKLGVLAGPDLQLLEQVIEDPGSLSNVLSGKEGVLSRYDQLQNTVNKGFDQRLENYGLLKGDAPQAQVPQKPAMSSEDQQALQWAMQNPRDPRAQKILQMNKMNAGR